MRVLSVTAHAFGPLVDETLELAPGLTVISGPNEAGKSSWHAATYAALCGRRRGKGKPSREELRFAEAHRPWSGGAWRVSALVSLGDGRRIEIHHDLDGLVDCWAIDADLNRDVSAEVMHDGAPDASRWLGLTRTSFRATAWVGQAQLLAVRDAAGALQEQLQRLADGAGTGGTAAAALDRLASYARSEVGRDTPGSTRPLRRAALAVDRARQQLAEAQQEHDDYLDVVQHSERCQQRVQSAERALAETERAARAAAASRATAAAQSRPTSTTRVLVLSAALLAVLTILAGVAGGRTVAAVLLGVLAVGSGAAALVTSRHTDDKPTIPPPSDNDALAEARQAYLAAVREAERCDGERAERARRLPSVAEAEEQLAAAEAELARLHRLGETLEVTAQFLRRAEERVHRDVAPLLAATLRSWLPRVTGDRYVDARVDPATLCVSIRGRDGPFRPADQLSHGTREQVYLLLRAALASHLGAGRETCPLLLDEVTVHADTERRHQLLALLLELSSERQVVLFSQQDEVADWARRHLRPELDRLVELAVVPVGAAP